MTKFLGKQRKMIFNFDIDDMIDSVTAAFEDAGQNMAEEQVAKIVDAIDKGMPGILGLFIKGMAEYWQNEALGAGGWGSKYAGAVKYTIDKDSGEAYLDEDILDKGSKKPNFMFAMMMEEGVKAWSIKKALLNSSKAKFRNGIKYIIVPFPVASPRKETTIKGTSQFQGREMTDAIHDIAKGGGIASGKLKSGQEVSGLTKYVTKQHHEQYGTFRIVTEKSKGWEYPNVPPEPVFPSVLNEANRRINEIITEFLKAIVKEYSS
jgi:hypothetical protein